VDEALLEIPARDFIRADLSAPLNLGRRFDLAISLEVAEHLPPEAAEGFVKTLTSAAPIVAFSAAVPGQTGVNHLNEQWPAYWAGLFARFGYEAIDCLRPVIWDDEEIEWWYAQNLLLFAEPAGVEANAALRAHSQRGTVPLALLHPRSPTSVTRSR
jgi:hypothetical protein